jgi:hypothetical protein
MLGGFHLLEVDEVGLELALDFEDVQPRLPIVADLRPERLVETAGG